MLRRIATMPDLRTGNMIQKFYKLASVRQSDLGFEVTLDGRAIRTPERNKLCLPSQPLAMAIASEWQAQDKFIKPHSMPLVISTQMQLSSTAIDLNHINIRPQLEERIIAFLRNDNIWQAF